MTAVVYALPGNEPLAVCLATCPGATLGELTVRRFPDGEWYLRVDTPPQAGAVVLVCSLDQPNDKLIALYLLAKSLREMGARRVVLVAPYLGYLRQDRSFALGEVVSARHIAQLLSGFIDGLVTVDPHLHRIHALGDVYSVPSIAVSAAAAISAWVRTNIAAPLIIGPDAESAQWVSRVADGAHCPHVVLEKVRHGDRDVAVQVPDLAGWQGRTPILVDDIVSTGGTLMSAAKQLISNNMPAPVCIGVHGLFVADAYAALLSSGVSSIVTTNTVDHCSNGIDLHEEIRTAVETFIDRG